VLGAGLVNGAKSFFTQAYPEYWLFFLGLLFILVTLLLPRGVIALPGMLRTRIAHRRTPAGAMASQGSAGARIP
jgi:hypothetical protein